MKIVTYNIHYAIGKDLLYDMDRIVESVRGADIVALQEVERFYGPPDQPIQPEEIASRLPDYYWVYDAAFDVDGSRQLESGCIQNRRMQHGQMLLSRWPIKSKRYFPLPRLDIGDTFNMQMGVLEGVVEAPIGPIRLYVVHFGSESSDERLLQSRFIIDLVENAPREGGAWTGSAEDNPERDWSGGIARPPMPRQAIVLGDFNMSPDSDEYDVLATAANGKDFPALIDAHAMTRTKNSTKTWHPISARNDGQISATLDYIFTTENLIGFVKDAWVDENAIGSDHQPVWIELDSER